jgi:signal transduction histidine kinase
MPTKLTERVLIFALLGADARNTRLLLEREGLLAEACESLTDLARKIPAGAGALLIAEEALRGEGVKEIVAFIASQPSWSDLPVLVVTTRGDTTLASIRDTAVLGERANITFVERPFRTLTLISTVRSALRSRRRQYEVADLVQNLEAKVAERTARLQQTVSDLEAFSYSVSHDLRAPLRAMQGYAFILKEDYKESLDESGMDYLQRIVTAANRLDQLVQDLLTYSKTARDQFVFEAVDLQSLVADIVRQYPLFQAPSAQVRISGKLAPVRGHEASLAQCVSNLLANAVKFQKPGSVPCVEIWSENGNGRVKVLFKDNGIGIPPEQQQRIFQIFERGSHHQAYEGTGIGLAIVKKAVERMGGVVGVESQPQVGSTFWFELPAAK